jgi:hypothetical protein
MTKHAAFNLLLFCLTIVGASVMAWIGAPLLNTISGAILPVAAVLWLVTVTVAGIRRPRAG